MGIYKGHKRMAQLDRPILPPFLYRYRPLANAGVLDREIRTIKEPYLWLARYRDLNDPMEGFYEPGSRLQKETTFTQVARKLVRAKREIGICSFSDTLGNELMWAHYGCYAGICIGYRPAFLIEGLPSDAHLVRLAYGNDPPSINNAETADAQSAAIKILSHKKSNWMYEREWRVLGSPGQLPITSKGCVRVVYLGSRIDPRHKEKILKELEDVHVNIFEMRVSKYSHQWTQIKRLK